MAFATISEVFLASKRASKRRRYHLIVGRERNSLSAIWVLVSPFDRRGRISFSRSVSWLSSSRIIWADSFSNAWSMTSSAASFSLRRRLARRSTRTSERRANESRMAPMAIVHACFFWVWRTLPVRSSLQAAAVFLVFVRGEVFIGLLKITKGLGCQGCFRSG